MSVEYKNTGVISVGIKCPMFKQGDDVVKIVSDCVLETFKGYNQYHDKYVYDINDKDIIGITESVVARTHGTYLTLDDLVKEIKEKCPSGEVALINPIYSRNRFSMILKAFARACNRILIIMPEYDEVGNPRGLNKVTGVNIMEYYKTLCYENNCVCEILNDYQELKNVFEYANIRKIDCSLRPDKLFNEFLTLRDFGTQINSTYGLLGSNKANEETLKLFPTVEDSVKTCYGIKNYIKEKTGKTVEVMVYGDGCFKDATSGIWEFADPDVSPFYTEGLDGSPNEIKTKYFIDGKFSNLNGDELECAIQNEIKNKKTNLVGSMSSQGTTPRKYVNLLASLMDLTSGSGDRCTPVVVVKNYFN